MIKFYGCPDCLKSLKVAVTLHEKALDAEFNWSEEASSTRISDEGVEIQGSRVIAEYLEDEYPEPALLPSDSEGRARVRMIIDAIENQLYPVAKSWSAQSGRHTPADIRAFSAKLESLLGSLKGRQFITGDFSMADCAMMPVIYRAATSGFATDELSLPLKSYWEALRQRPGYRALENSQKSPVS